MALPARKRETGSAEEQFAPHLNLEEQEQVEEKSASSVAVVHEAIRKEGEEELRRPASALAWSGLAAGLSMGFSLVAEGLLRSHLPDTEWRPLIAKLGYSIGFLIVVLGRQQLFTENTLTVILPLMARRDFPTLLSVLRLWTVVLAANLLGTFLFALVLGHTGVFDPDVRAVFGEIGREAMQAGFGVTLLRGIFAGWLIAL
ncbi:MAG TPA: formate/nitrite transporter family protein, partial [Armatimonadota bacterium]|nr:formate/nitrite transporter family protein [Armatimonadota bacterium]